MEISVDAAIRRPIRKIIQFIIKKWKKEALPQKVRAITERARIRRLVRLGKFFQVPVIDITYKMVVAFVDYWVARGLKHPKDDFKGSIYRHLSELSRLIWDLEIINEDNVAYQYLKSINENYKGPGRKYSQRVIEKGPVPDRKDALREPPLKKTAAPHLGLINPDDPPGFAEMVEDKILRKRTTKLSQNHQKQL